MCNNNVRDIEIAFAYFALLRYYMNSGKSKREASITTYDDLELRFCVTKKTIRLIKNQNIKSLNSMCQIDIKEKYTRLREISNIITNAIEKD